MGKLKEIIINGKSHSVIEDGVPVYMYNRNEPTSSIKINGKDPFKYGRPIILKGESDETFNNFFYNDIFNFFT